MSPRDFGARVIQWFDENQRDLPWRRESDPYRVWLSEVMLQQTRVETVLPYYRRFLESYPTLEALAEADLDSVLDKWSGLGYYRRARFFHAAVQRIQSDFDGRIPDSYDDFITLPGVGRYTAGAVLSLAFGLPLPVLDGNVKRVLTRFLKWEEPPPERKIWGVLETLVEVPETAHRISSFNQGLMELGALVCRPGRPLCRRCPVRTSCRAREAGVESELPAAKKRRRTERVDFTVLLFSYQGAYLMELNEEGPYLRGFWDFPKIAGQLPAREVPSACRRHLGLTVKDCVAVKPVRHQVTFRKLTFHPFQAKLIDAADIPPRFSWRYDSDPERPVSAHVEKILRRVEQGR